MRVLWIAPGFAAHEHDFNCIPPLQLLAKEFISHKIDLEIITLAYPFTSVPYNWNGIKVFSSYGFNKNILKGINYLRAEKHAINRNKIQKFDLIHSFWLGPSWLVGQRLQRKFQIPHLNTLMGQDVLKSNRYLRFVKSKNSKSLIALTEFQKEIFETTTKIHAGHVIPWGIQNSEVSKLSGSNRTIDILGCGSLIPLKNWALWLNLIEELVKHKTDLKAEIIGNGPQRNTIELLIKQKGLQDHVFLAGNLPRPQVLARMRSAKVFLHTSSFESFGYVLVEAAMNGCHLVSTLVGIAPEITEFTADGELLIEKVKVALSLKNSEAPFIPFTMAESAEKYLKLYGEKLI